MAIREVTLKEISVNLIFLIIKINILNYIFKVMHKYDLNYRDILLSLVFILSYNKVYYKVFKYGQINI